MSVDDATRPGPRPADPCSFVVFGATGDLTRRLLMPALYNLAASNLLPDAVRYARHRPGGAGGGGVPGGPRLKAFAALPPALSILTSPIGFSPGSVT